MGLSTWPQHDSVLWRKSVPLNTTSLLSTQRVCPVLHFWDDLGMKPGSISWCQSKANPLSSSNLVVSSLTLSSPIQAFSWMHSNKHKYTHKSSDAKCWTEFCAACCSSLLQSPTMNHLTVNLRNHNLCHMRQWKNNSDCCAWVCQYDRNLMKWEWT